MQNLVFLMDMDKIYFFFQMDLDLHQDKNVKLINQVENFIKNKNFL